MAIPAIMIRHLPQCVIDPFSLPYPIVLARHHKRLSVLNTNPSKLDSMKSDRI